MEFIVSTKPPYVYNYHIISVLNKSNPDICPQIYLQHLPNDTVLPFCDSCLRHGSSRSHWSTPNAHLGKRWFVWDIEDGKKIDTCGLPIYYIHILRKVWDSSFSVCVCRETSQAGQLHVSILATRILDVSIQICIYIYTYIYIYVYKCDNVYMLPMSVWDVSWSFHQVLRNWLCEHFTFVTQPRHRWSQWLVVFTSTKSNN